MKLRILLGLGLASLCGQVWAQNCPAGIPSAGNPACIPPDRENSPYYQGHGGPNQATAPRMKWADRWGAIAADGEKAVLGTATGMTSKRKAESAALSQCRNKGGTACKINLAYYNQCAVMVTGDKTYMSQGAATVDEASQLGMRRCNEVDSNCRVYYTDCSMAERIQ